MDQAEAVKDWQRGYDLEMLRARAAPFKERHKALVFGGFGLTKERDVAEALQRGRFHSVGAQGRFEAAALVKPLKSVATFRDFRGEELVLTEGLYVSAFAAVFPEAGARLLRALREKITRGALYVEIFEEDNVAKHILLHLGFSWRSTKIAAGSELKGVYVFGSAYGDARLPLEEVTVIKVLERDFLSQFDNLTICEELRRAGLPWEQHYSNYNKRKSWTGFALRGFSADPSFIIKPAEMAQSWKEANPEAMKATPHWTTAFDRFIWTVRVVRRLLKQIGRTDADLDRVRFLRLAGGGELTRHADITDREAGVAEGKLTRLHIPIVTNDTVQMRGWNVRGREETAHFPTNSLCYLDQRKPHAVRNPGQAERIHLVLDVRGSAALRQQIGETHNARSAAMA